MAIPLDDLKAALLQIAREDPALIDELLGDRFFKHPAPPDLSDPRVTVSESAGVSPQAHIEILGDSTIDIGQHTKIGPCAWLRAWGDSGIRIGDHCTLNQYSMINGSVTLGDGVRIGAHSLIIATEHNFDRTDVPIHQQGVTSGCVTIASDVYIGSNVTILNDVNIGEGSVLAAGAVVNRDVPPHVVVGGVPAKVIKHRK